MIIASKRNIFLLLVTETFCDLFACFIIISVEISFLLIQTPSMSLLKYYVSTSILKYIPKHHISVILSGK